MQRQPGKDVECFAYEYVRHSLTDILGKEIINYIGNALSLSASRLRQRSSLLLEIAGNKDYASVRSEDMKPHEVLEAYIGHVDREKVILKEQIPKTITRGRELKKKRIDYDVEAAVQKIEDDGYNLDREQERAVQQKQYLGEEQEVYVAITPVKTSDYEAMRVILPIGSQIPIPLESVTDYLFTTLSSEITLRFQQDAFGDNSPDGVHLVVNKTSRDAFYALDIECDLDESDLEEMQHDLGKFVMDVINNGAEYFLKQRVSLRNEFDEGNLFLAQLLFPIDYEQFVSDYMKNVDEDLDALHNEFTTFIERQGLVGEGISREDLFTDLNPYTKTLEELCAKHAPLLLASFYQKHFGVEYKESDDVSTEQVGRQDIATRLVSADQAKAILSIPDSVYDRAKEAGTFHTKIIDGVEHVLADDILTFPDKSIRRGKYTMATFDEPVIASTDLARQHQLDNDKLKRLIHQGVIEPKAVLRRKDKQAYAYVFAVAEVDNIMDLYHAND